MHRRARLRRARPAARVRAPASDVLTTRAPPARRPPAPGHHRARAHAACAARSEFEAEQSVAAPSAAAALTVGAAVGVGPSAAAAFLPPAAYRPPPPDRLGRRLALAAAGFGNTLTLPLLFLYALLPGAAADAAAGYVALFLIGWSPALWSIGYALLVVSDERAQDDTQGDGDAPGSACARARGGAGIGRGGYPIERE